MKIEKTSLFKEEWERVEKIKERPDTYRKVICIEYEEFISKINNQEKKFVEAVVDSIYNGDLYILKNALNKKTVANIIDSSTEFFKKNPEAFHKMIEGTPNFHRWIDEEVAGNYSIRHVKHSLYLFNWNKDVSNIRETVLKACEPLKILSGLEFNQYSKNTAKDHIVERVQIVRYPPGGYIEPHYDNNKIIRLIISGYLSKRGDDYKKGGFYLIDKKRKLDMEDYIDSGDIGFFYASLKHGMETIDPKDKIVKFEKSGRWWFGYNIHNSDVVRQSDRHVATPVNLNY